MTRYIFVTGSVVSSLGKGIATASIGMIIKNLGYSVCLKKIDPYLNVDPGTMNPNQHGEVFVTDDGAETDLDLGHYERFTDVATSRVNNTTAGKIYQELITAERRGDYLGETVQVIPHVTALIKNFIRKTEGDVDFVICEIGGTVGDIEAFPFLEAIRQMQYCAGKKNVMYINLTLVPYIEVSKETKTKPTQHAVKELMSVGIKPDLLICRSTNSIPDDQKMKISTFCNVDQDYVFSLPDVKNVYEIPLLYINQKLDEAIFNFFGISKNYQNLKENFVNKLSNLVYHEETREITIGIVGKYSKNGDSYKSISESLKHAQLHLEVKVNVVFIDSKIGYEAIESKIKEVDGVIVPGGFGSSGLEGKMVAIKACRENGVPVLGICLGMQLMIVEFLRNVCGMENASSSELQNDCSPSDCVVGLMENQKENMNLGGTMRLGSYKANLKEGSLAHKVYGSQVAHERHRHRYEVDINIQSKIEANGMDITGVNGLLPEIIEIANHPFFIGVQFHPEFKSTLFNPHPLFMSLIKKCIEQKQ